VKVFVPQVQLVVEAKLAALQVWKHWTKLPVLSSASSAAPCAKTQPRVTSTKAMMRDLEVTISMQAAGTAGG